MNKNGEQGRGIQGPLQELKMFVYRTAQDQSATTIGIVVPEFNKWAKKAADEAIRLKEREMGEEEKGKGEGESEVRYLMAAVMLVDEELTKDITANDQYNYTVENLSVGLAVVEERDPCSPLLPDQNQWLEGEGGGVRLLQTVEFEEGRMLGQLHGESESDYGSPRWLGDDDLSISVHPDWGEGGFILEVINESDIYAAMPFEELARRGLLRTAVEVKPSSAVLVMTEGEAPVAYVIDENGELNQVDARKLIKNLVDTEIERQATMPAEVETRTGEDKWVRPPEDQMQDILSLASVFPPADVIAGWTDEEAELAVEWAGAVHFSASDNEDVEIPPCPKYLKEYGGRDYRQTKKTEEEEER